MPDNASFIFSVSKKTKHLCHDKENAVWMHSGSSVVFGGGNSDIFINDNCNVKMSHCLLGSSYYLPHDLEEDSTEEDNYLAGSLRFKVIDIEVYTVKFI